MLRNIFRKIFALAIMVAMIVNCIPSYVAYADEGGDTRIDENGQTAETSVALNYTIPEVKMCTITVYVQETAWNSTDGVYEFVSQEALDGIFDTGMAVSVEEGSTIKDVIKTLCAENSGFIYSPKWDEASGLTLNEIMVARYGNGSGDKFASGDWDDTWVQAGETNHTFWTYIEGTPQGETASFDQYKKNMNDFSASEDATITLSYMKVADIVPEVLEQLALLFSDGSLVFTTDRASAVEEHGGEPEAEYRDWDTVVYSSATDVPWNGNASKITTVEFRDAVSTISTAYWFQDCNSLTTVTGISNLDLSNATDMNSMFYQCGALTSIEGIENLNVGNVTHMGWLFYGCTNLASLNLSNWDTGNVKNMKSMFYNCGSLGSIPGVEDFNTQSVTEMGFMFYGCSGLTSLDLSSWKTGNVLNTNLMFQNCGGLTSLNLTSWDTGNVKDMNSMFYNCSGLTSIPGVDGFNTQNVTDMRWLFYECSGLEDLDLRAWKTNNVTSMQSMFYDCSSLTSIPGVDDFVTDKVTSMGWMFYGCKKLASLNVSKWKTGQVTTLQSMFYDCTSLDAITGTENWDTSNVTNMYSTFYDCANLKILNLTGWNTGKVTTMYYTFCKCSLLNDITGIESLDVHSVGNMSHLFCMSPKLTQLDLSQWKTNSLTVMDSMFYESTGLQTIDILTKRQVAECIVVLFLLAVVKTEKSTS